MPTTAAALLLALLLPAPQEGALAPLSETSESCVACHELLQPGIVADWRHGRHARVTPAQALAREELERRVSAAEVPEELREVAVGCYECHGLNADSHPDTVEHFGEEIHVVVTPEDCRVCHPTEVEEYAGSKKAYALDNLRRNPVFTTMVETVNGVHGMRGGELASLGASEDAKNSTCYACHGAEVKVTGTVTRTLLGQDADFPVLSNWPNQGVGRVNPDGSRGACTACHPRHGFSIEVARKPHTCAQCHLGPDVPAHGVYHESKHGNLFDSDGDDYDWDHVPWRVGTDFRAPTCATCHSALIANPDGDELVPRTHDFGARLWVRIFGLPYSHPQPASGRTFELRNADGQPLPTTFAGEPAAEGLIDAAEQDRREAAMKGLCNQCHATSWVDGHFARFDKAVEESDRMVLASTQLVQRAWEAGLVDPANPFDEAFERKWIRQWMFHANSIRYAAAMSGQDYATFEHGWFQLTETLAEMREWLAERLPK